MRTPPSENDPFEVLFPQRGSETAIGMPLLISSCLHQSRVHIQDVFHAPDKLGSGLGRAPLLLQPGLEFIFFSAWRTVSSLPRSTYSSWTILSASIRGLQHCWPFGAGLHAS